MHHFVESIFCRAAEDDNLSAIFLNGLATFYQKAVASTVVVGLEVKHSQIQGAHRNQTMIVSVQMHVLTHLRDPLASPY
ncbi:MAG TPA: hypothetical protein DEP80_03835 [Anaerolineae bacterium]|nr:hypothetical protein [Anaerolineae bacterium]